MKRILQFRSNKHATETKMPTVFCEISVQRSKNCLEFFIDSGTLNENIVQNHLNITSFGAKYSVSYEWKYLNKLNLYHIISFIFCWTQCQVCDKIIAVSHSISHSFSLVCTKTTEYFSSFLVLRTGAMTEWRHAKGLKDTEKYPHHKTKANKQ